jgi:uncharacterized OsmC-like protein
MHVLARVANAQHSHHASVATDGREQSVAIPPKAAGPGSGLNGGELLFLALATCYCNDLYREAQAGGLTLRHVEVEVEGEFGGRGEPARGIVYHARVAGDAPPERLSQLLRDTDRVAEIHNTLRQGCPVRFAGEMVGA